MFLTKKMLVPEEQLSKLRSPRMTSKATWSSRTFSSSVGAKVFLLNSAPHSSSMSNCSQRTDASPERGRQIYANNTYQQLKSNLVHKITNFILRRVLFNKKCTDRIVQNNSFDLGLIQWNSVAPRRLQFITFSRLVLGQLWQM